MFLRLSMNEVKEIVIGHLRQKYGIGNDVEGSVIHCDDQPFDVVVNTEVEKWEFLKSVKSD